LAGRGQTTFKKRQKEQQRKDRQQAKIEKRIQRKSEAGGESESPDRPGLDTDQTLDKTSQV